MQNKLFSALKDILRILAVSTLRKYKPFIIGVTGSVGKTSTKSAIYAVLKPSFNVRKGGGNLNNEFGMPLTVLGNYEEGGGPGFWIKVLLKSVLRLIFRRRYPEILILEYAADKRGDINYLLTIAKPNIALVTAIGEVPAHLESYDGPEAIVKEKARLPQSLGANDWAVFNFDDPAVIEMKEKVKSQMMTFGFNEGADVRIVNFENRSESNKPTGISFKLEVGGSFLPVRIDGVFGSAQAYASAAAAAVGLIKGLNLVKISEALSHYKGEKGRTRLISGIKNTRIIDDTYNASPLSVEAALNTVKELPALRKVAILGDIGELGKYATYAHEKIGKVVYGAADVLITIGPKARFIAEGARKKGFSKKNIYSFNDLEEAGEIHNIIQNGDLILVKGSPFTRMEKVVAKIMLEPRRAKELLVRQHGRWLKT